MEDVRRERQLGRITTFEMSYPTESSAMEAKFRIAELLDLPINCVERFREHAGLQTASRPRRRRRRRITEALWQRRHPEVYT